MSVLAKNSQYLIPPTSAYISPRFPLAQRLGEQRRELDAPLAKGFVADDDASLLEQFLRISVSEWEAVEPYRVLDDAD